MGHGCGEHGWADLRDRDVSMVFISLTSAYVVRQGLPTFDGATNSYVRDWGQVQLPWCCWPSYRVVADQQFDDGIRAAGYQAAGGSGSAAIDAGDFSGQRKKLSLAGRDGGPRACVSGGQWMRGES